jgi:hypothetical protein
MYFPEDIWRIIKEYQLNFNPTLKRLDYQYSIEAYLEDFNDTYADEYNSDTDTDTSGYFQVNKTIIQILPKMYFMITKIRLDTNYYEDMVYNHNGELITIENPDTIIKTIYSFCKKNYKLDKKINKDLKICYLPVAILQRPEPQPKTAEQLHYMLWRHNQVKTIKMNDLPAILDEFYVNLIKTEIMKNLVNHYTYNL